MSHREDGLPQPVTTADEYLAAILAELRGLRAYLSPPAPAEDAVPELVHVAEPVSGTPHIPEDSAEVDGPSGPTGPETGFEDAAEAAPAASEPAKPKPKRNRRKRA